MHQVTWISCGIRLSIDSCAASLNVSENFTLSISHNSHSSEAAVFTHNACSGLIYASLAAFGPLGEQDEVNVAVGGRVSIDKTQHNNTKGTQVKSFNVSLPLLVAALFTTSAAADPILIPDTQFFGLASASVQLNGQTFSQDIPVTGLGPFPAQQGGVGVGAVAEATVTVGLLPSPSLLTSYTAQSSPVNAYGADGIAFAALTYSFAILGGSSSVGVPITVTSSGSASGPTADVLGIHVNSPSAAYFVLSTPADFLGNPYGIGRTVENIGASACVSAGISCDGGRSEAIRNEKFIGPDASFTNLVQSTTLFTNTLYNVTLYANSAASISGFLGGGSATGTAFIDPVFAIDSAFNADGRYSFAFSSGVGNSPAATVAEPETYALMIAGLGVIGFVLRRKKK